MNPLWLLVIVPVSASFGALVMGLCSTASREDRRMEKEAAQLDSERE